MKSSKILGLAVAAVLGSASVSVWAVPAVDMDATTPTPLYYASEIDRESSSSIVLPVNQTVKKNLGFSFTANKNVFVRIDLVGASLKGTGAATWSASAPAAANLAAVAAANIIAVSSHITGDAAHPFGENDINTNDFAGIALSNSGHADDGTPFAVLNFTTNAGNGTAGTEWILVNFADAKVFFNGAPGSLSLRYRLYEGATDANGGTTNTVVDKTVKIVDFTPALNLSMTTPRERTASVMEKYLKFQAASSIPNTAAGTKATLGETLALGINTTVNGNATTIRSVTGAAMTLPNLLNTSTLTLKGDFSGASKVWLDENVACTTTTSAGWAANRDYLLGTISADKKTVSFATGDTEILVGDTVNVCYTADGTTAIPASQITMDLTPVGETGYTKVSAVTGKSVGEIKRDGVILRSGFVSRFGIGVSRFIIANTGSTDAEITNVKFYGNAAGATVQPTLKATLPIKLPAGARTAIEMADLVDLATMPLQNTMVEFGVSALDDNIFGTYQLLLAGSTVQTVIPLERPVSAIK